MKYEDRIPNELFGKDGHYLGRPADFRDRIIDRRLRLLKNIPDFIGKEHSLLEIGCGNGALLFLLCERMENCLGIDITNKHETEFNEYKREHKIRNCDFSIVDVVNSIPDQTFDRIISFEVIEHLSDESGLQYYYDSLKDDGILAISVPNKWWIFETHGSRLPLLPWNRVPFFSWLPRPIHERLANARIYTKKRIRRLLVGYGFEIMDMGYITAPMDVLPDGRLKKWLIGNIFKTDLTSIPFKATSIFVVVKKRK